MAIKETSCLDFNINNVQQEDQYLLMDYRIPKPGSGDEGKVPMYVGSTYFEWTKHLGAAAATATASTASYAASQGYGELSATLADVNPHGLVKVLYSYTPSQSFAVRFANDGSTYRPIKYRGAWLNTNDTGIIRSGDTALLWYDGSVLNLITVDRAAQHKTILHNEVFGRGDFNVHDGYYFPNAVRDVDGNWYGAVIIGDQVWLAENLRTKHYSDNTIIAYGGTNYSDETPYFYYPYGLADNEEEGGLLYNHPAVMNGATPNNTNPSGIQGISPTGWHIPSSAEWQQLVSYLSSNSRYFSDGVTSSYIAKALAAAQGWTASSTEYDVGNNQATNNKSGFNAIPAGGMSISASNTVSYDCYNQACFFSTSYYGNGPSIQTWRLAANNDNDVFYWGRNKNSAHSVRCVCDKTPEQFIDWYVRTYGSMQHHLVDTNVLYGYCYENTYGLMEVFLYGNETITELQRRNPAFLVGLLFSDDMPSGNNGYVVEQVDGQYNAYDLLIHGNALAVGDIKAGDLCFFVYEAGDLQLVSNDRWKSDIAAKQDVLVGSGNGQNIKTVNGNSLPGSGNIELGKGTLTGLATSLTNSSANVTINEIGADLEHGAFLFIQFAVDMPALARLNVANTVISNSDIIWNNTTLPAGAIKSGDICLFYYAYANGTNMSFLQWNSRWACLKTINNGTLSGNGNISLAPPHTYYSTSMATANATTAITCAANERAFHVIAVTAANTQLNVTLANNWDNVIFLTGVYNLKLNIMIGGNAAPVHFESNNFFDGTNVNLSKAGTLKIVLEAVDGNVIADVDLMESYIPSN